MRAIRSKDSKIEIALRKELWDAGLKYRKNAKNYFGKPDIVLKKYNTVIFVDSCFWHGCKSHCRIPNTNKTYWGAKIRRNRERDKKVNSWYKKNGWTIFRFWEHSINKNIDACISKIEKTLKKRI